MQPKIFTETCVKILLNGVLTSEKPHVAVWLVEMHSKHLEQDEIYSILQFYARYYVRYRNTQTLDCVRKLIQLDLKLSKQEIKNELQYACNFNFELFTLYVNSFQGLTRDDFKELLDANMGARLRHVRQARNLIEDKFPA